MDEQDWLTSQFEENRDHLKTVAYRMLGSMTEAEDAVQETWLRLSRSDARGLENLGGWLTTVTARVCLDALRSRRIREPSTRSPRVEAGRDADPEQDLLLADSIGPAMLVVLDALEPAERVALVLHDMFDMTFDEIAPIVGRSPGAARQLASRARRRIHGLAAPEAELHRHRQIVDAFLLASRDGNLEALLRVLDPDVVLRADDLAVETAVATKWGGMDGLPSEVRGARAVAKTLARRRHGAKQAFIDGSPGAAWVQNGRTLGVWLFTVDDSKIVEIELVMNPDHLACLEVVGHPSTAGSKRSPG